MDLTILAEIFILREQGGVCKALAEAGDVKKVPFKNSSPFELPGSLALVLIDANYPTNVILSAASEDL